MNLLAWISADFVSNLHPTCMFVFPSQMGLDTGNMVKSTCTTFLKTLEECMQIANRTFTTDLATQSPPGTPPVAPIKPQKVYFSHQLCVGKLV